MFMVLFILSYIVHNSLSAIPSSSNLLLTPVTAQFSPSNSFCCNGTGTTGCATVSTSPSCAYDGDSSTRWMLNTGQLNASLTLTLATPSVIDHFELTLDQSSIIPTSIVVTVTSPSGSPVTSWETYLNKSCQPNDSRLRNVNSVYFSCTQSSQPWNVPVPDGLFSIKNGGSDGWLWWIPFQTLQITMTMNNTDYSPPTASFAIQDIRLFGWTQPNQPCNCHPVGVANTSSPCQPNGTCNCTAGGNGNSQCIPSVTVVNPPFGPVSGGTIVVIGGSYLQNPSSVTVGNSYPASVIHIADINLEIQTNGSATNDVNNPLPIWICWQLPNGVKSCIVTSYTFTYLPDPIVQSISPRKSIESGGITQTITGQNLDSVAYPYLIIFSVNGGQVLNVYNYTNRPYKYISDTFCNHVNSTMLTCVSMPLYGVSSLSSTDVKLYVGISVDIANYNTYNGQCYFGAGQCDFTLVADGLLNLVQWSDDPMGYPVYQSKNSLTISGQSFLDGATVGDYRITVGGITCDILGIVSNAIVFNPPDVSDIGDTSRQQPTILYIGAYFSFTQGDLMYYPTWISDPKNRNPLIGGIVGGVGGLLLLIAIIVVAVVFWRRRSRNKQRSAGPESFNEGRYDNHRSNIPITEYLPEELQDSIKRYTVPFERILLQRALGKGQFGKVYQGTLMDKDGVKQPVAIKTLHTDHRDNKDKIEFLAEAMLMADFCHNHVLSLLAIVIEKNTPFVVLPLMENGDLKGFVSSSNNTFTAGDLVNFSLQVAEGMEYLASKKFVHRDLAARNCMVNKDLLVKVADFGLARDIFENDYYRQQDRDRPLPFKWMAIECLTSNTCFTEKSDVWSYGVLLWELMTRGKQPYSHVDNFDLRKFLQEGRRLEKPAAAPDFMYDIMIRCWEAEPKARPQFKDIVKDLKEILSLVDLNSDQLHHAVNGAQYQDVIAEARYSYLELMRHSSSSNEHH